MSDATTKGTYRELVTIDGKNVVLAHNEPPVINAGVLENGDIFRMINIFVEKFSPTNERHGIFFTGLGSSP